MNVFIHTRAVTAILVIVAVLNAGCTNPIEIPSLHAGDWARYAGPDNVTLDVLVVGEAQLRDLDGAIVTGLRFNQWLNRSDHIVARVSLVDSESGELIWSAIRCGPVDCSSIAASAALRGTPAAFGQAWLRTDGARHAVREGDCLGFDGSHHPANDRYRAGIGPGDIEGRPMRFCADSSLPIRLTLEDGSIFERIADKKGAGRTYPFVGPSSVRNLSQPATTSWTGQRPTGPEPSESHFPLAEAWSWMAQHSTAFREFRTDHPTHFLTRTIMTGSSSATTAIPILSDSNEYSYERYVEVGSPHGETIGMVLRKTVSNGGSAIRELGSEKASGEPALNVEKMSPKMISMRQATERFLALVPGQWRDTAVTTSHEVVDKWLPTTSFYTYEVLVEPPGSGDTYSPYVGVYRSDTGEPFRLVVDSATLGLKK